MCVVRRGGVRNQIPADDIKNLINKNRSDTNRAPSELGQGARFVDLLMTCLRRHVGDSSQCSRRKCTFWHALRKKLATRNSPSSDVCGARSVVDARNGENQVSSIALTSRSYKLRINSRYTRFSTLQLVKRVASTRRKKSHGHAD